MQALGTILVTFWWLEQSNGHTCGKYGPKGAIPGEKVVQNGSKLGTLGATWSQNGAKRLQKGSQKRFCKQKVT